MYRPLAPCPRCARHVRVTERRCPFCNDDLPGLEGAARALGGVSTRGLSRAAVVMLGASMAVACGSPPSPAPPGPDAPADPSGPPAPPDDDGAPAAEYGAPMPDEPPPDDASGPPDDSGGMAPKYGAPAPVDP